MKVYQFLFLFRVIGICYSLPQTLRQLPQPSDVIFNEHPLSETTKINNRLVLLTTLEHRKLIHSHTGKIFVIWKLITKLPSSPTERNENGQDVSAVSTYSPDLFHPTVPTARPRIPIAEPNFPRVAIPFAIGMWVLGICIVKTGIINHFIFTKLPLFPYFPCQLWTVGRNC